MKTISVCILATAVLVLSGCARHREFRVAYVGSEPSAAAAASAASADSSPLLAAQGAPLIVASGNALLGPASQLVTSITAVPTTGVVDGTVSSLVLTTDQTVVQLTNGSSVILDGTGAALGDVVSIDLGIGKVIGGPSSLVGVSVSPEGATTGGQLASVSVGPKTATINSPTVGLPTLPSPTLGSPTLGSPALGTPTGAVSLISPPSTGLPVPGVLGGLCC